MTRKSEMYIKRANEMFEEAAELEKKATLLKMLGMKKKSDKLFGLARAAREIGEEDVERAVKYSEEAC